MMALSEHTKSREVNTPPVSGWLIRHYPLVAIEFAAVV